MSATHEDDAAFSGENENGSGKIYWFAAHPTAPPIGQRAVRWLAENTGDPGCISTGRVEIVTGSEKLEASAVFGWIVVELPDEPQNVRATLRDFLKSLPRDRRLSIAFSLNPKFLVRNMSFIATRLLNWNLWNANAVELLAPTENAIAYAECLGGLAAIESKYQHHHPRPSNPLLTLREPSIRIAPQCIQRREEDRALVIASYLFGFSTPIIYQRPRTAAPRLNIFWVPKDLEEESATDT